MVVHNSKLQISVIVILVILADINRLEFKLLDFFSGFSTSLMSQCRTCPLAVAYEQPNVTGKYHSRQSLLEASPLAHRAPSCPSFMEVPS